MENNLTLFDTPEKIYQHYKETGLMPPNYMKFERETAIISIDPGASGAVCVLSASGETIVHKMPDTPKDLLELLRSISLTYETTCYLEKVGGLPKMGGSSMFNFGQGYGHLEMALLALNIKIPTPKS